jgi:hypothetical protein
MRHRFWNTIILGLLLTTVPLNAFAIDHDVESSIRTTQNDVRDYTAFFDQFYPETEVDDSLAILDLSYSELSRFEGTYRWVRYDHSTIGKVIAFLPQYNLIVTANDDGTLAVLKRFLD